jgi:hypothetical protein
MQRLTAEPVAPTLLSVQVSETTKENLHQEGVRTAYIYAKACVPN